MKRKARKPRPIERLMRSHKHLLESHRGLIEEIGHLRVSLLSMRNSICEMRESFIRERASRLAAPVLQPLQQPWDNKFHWGNYPISTSRGDVLDK